MHSSLRDWKAMMIIVLSGQEILTYSILPKGKTVDHQVYLEFLTTRVEPEVRRRHMGRPYILHDNASPHKHRLVRQFLQAKKWEELDHPPYSPDMSPPDMHGIMLVKGPNKGKRFESENELHHDYEVTIREVNQKASSKGIMMLPDRWRAVANANGKYVE